MTTCKAGGFSRKNKKIQSSFLKDTDTKWLEKTSIEDVIPFLDTVVFSVTRPTSGTNQGGVAYIRDNNNNNKLIASIKVPGNSSPVRVTLQDDKLNFEDGSYILEYGPDQVDQPVYVAVAATVNIVQAQPQNFQPSTCTPYNNSESHILSRYHIPRQILGNGNKISFYAVKGDKLKDDSYAIGNIIENLPETAPDQGLALLEGYSNGTFVRGEKYTVCMNVYSWKRQIAGYTFTY